MNISIPSHAQQREATRKRRIYAHTRPLDRYATLGKSIIFLTFDTASSAQTESFSTVVVMIFFTCRKCSLYGPSERVAIPTRAISVIG